MPIPIGSSNIGQSFYLIGDDAESSKSVHVDARWKLEDIKRAVGLVFHVAQPLGIIPTLRSEWTVLLTCIML